MMTSDRNAQVIAAAKRFNVTAAFCSFIDRYALLIENKFIGFVRWVRGDWLALTDTVGGEMKSSREDTLGLAILRVLVENERRAACDEDE